MKSLLMVYKEITLLLIIFESEYLFSPISLNEQFFFWVFETIYQGFDLFYRERVHVILSNAIAVASPPPIHRAATPRESP